MTTHGPGGVVLSVTVTGLASHPVSVGFRVANIGKIAYEGIPNDDFTVVDSRGATHARTVGPVDGDARLRITVAPGTTGSGTVPFDLQPGTTVRAIRFTIPGGDTATWTVR